jgi:hypothetical protein
VLGQISWSNDVRELSELTKPYFKQLVKWIQSNWSIYGDFYVGPEAATLVEQGAERVNVIPGTAEFSLKII